MSNSAPLLVPMTVEAFVVNDHVRTGGKPFMRTPMMYASLGSPGNAQPRPTNNSNDPNFTGSSDVNNIPPSEYYNGVYLKWRMPAALTKGAHCRASGATVFPPVPNRWLIVRLKGVSPNRHASAWIVESDYVWPSGTISPTTIAQAPSLYVSATGNVPGEFHMGRNVPLGAWTESGVTLHLTAVAPGNPAFAFYQPYNNNVFSFVDVLANGEDDTLSYLVLGWFSDPGDDPLACVSAEDFRKKLTTLGWTLPEHTALTTQTTFLAGSVCDVTWQTETVPPGGAPDPYNTPVSISVGNSSAEALTAMVAAQQAALGGDSVDADLLEAFQLNLLDVLDEPDGAAILAEKLQESFFQRFSGGYSWTIVDAPGSTETISDAEREKEQAWLATLSANQEALDAAIRALTALQTQLYVAWWKYASWLNALLCPSNVLPELNDQDNLKNLIDPAIWGSIGQRTAAQQSLVHRLAARVPNGDTPEALQAAIAHYSKEQQLPDCRVLKRTAAPPFYLPNNPVVLISGAGASGIVDDSGGVLCRFPSQLVTGFQFGGVTVTASTLGRAIPQPNLSGVSGAPWSTALVTALVNEFFLIDPANAAAISAVIPNSTVSAVREAIKNPANFTGTYPTREPPVWTKNPWHPLLLMWQAAYYPIAYGTPNAPNWTFQDGQYVWNGASQSVETHTSFEGLIQLSPTASFNMRARIKAFLRDNPNINPQERAEFQKLLDFVQHNDNWDLLSQSLNGFNESMRLGWAGVFLGPDSTSLVSTSLVANPPLPILIGEADTYPPNLGTIPINAPIPPSRFQPWRSGQFYFTQLLVIDEWGQALWPIDQATAATETVYLPPDLMPVRTSNPVSFAITATRARARPALTVASGPVITGLSPDLIQAGMAPSAQIPVTVNGSGFGTDSVVAWNGIPLSIAIVSGTEITAYVPANFIMEAGAYPITVTSGGATSPQRIFTVSAGPAIGTLDPASAVAGGPAFTLTATGVGFAPGSRLTWNGAPLETTFVSPTQLTASVPASNIAAVGTVAVTEVFGHQIFPNVTDSFIQLPPALVQPARLNFDLLSAVDDKVRFGPTAPTADPICGWVLPNHLDASLMAYDAQGGALGEMTLGYNSSNQRTVFWTPAPGSPYATLQQIAAAIPHFGPFLLALWQQGPTTFAALLRAIDETLWTTVPMGAVFDQDLTVLMGRPLAMVRARLRFELDGPPYADPSWQFTFEPAPPAITGYQFPIELGNIARLSDGLIGYFTGDDYGRFNVVQQAVSVTNQYLAPIGANNNYIYLPFDGKTSAALSMLVDPRAAVHATTAILPVVELSLPPQFVTNALAAMSVTFQVNGALTDQTISAAGTTRILIPVPREKKGTWSWIENDGGTWTTYETGPNDTTARLSTVAPVLRRGLLQLSPGAGGGRRAFHRRSS